MKLALFTKSCWTSSSKYLPYQLLENGGNLLTGFHKSSSCRSCAHLVASLTENKYSRQKETFKRASMATAATTSKDGYIPDDHPRPPSTTVNNHDRPMLKLNKVAVVGKMTRYEFEKLRYKDYSEEEFKSMLRNRGSNYENLLMQHKKHVQTMEKLMEVLKQRGIEYRICTRGQSEYSKVAVDWADAIITAGGDGTFLSAASKILSRTKPLIGINTDTERSEGHLCLPAKYSHNINEALDKISQSRFRWLYRQRLRITMTGTEENFEPLENGYILQHRMRDRLQRTASTYFSIDDSDDDSFIIDRKKQQRPGTPSGYQQGVSSRTLPVLALNEIFIGESLASVPSYYEFQVDNEEPEKQKSSGICVSTGTGSTAWSYNICRIHHKSVNSVLSIAHEFMSNNNNKDGVQHDLVQKVTNSYAKSFIFEASDPQMLYAIRDPMQNKVYSCKKPYGVGSKLHIRSRCWDATLCIDGDTSFVFNDGSSITVQILPVDALRTVVLDED